MIPTLAITYLDRIPATYAKCSSDFGCTPSNFVQLSYSLYRALVKSAHGVIAPSGCPSMFHIFGMCDNFKVVNLIIAPILVLMVYLFSGINLAIQAFPNISMNKMVFGLSIGSRFECKVPIRKFAKANLLPCFGQSPSVIIPAPNFPVFTGSISIISRMWIYALHALPPYRIMGQPVGGVNSTRVRGTR